MSITTTGEIINEIQTHSGFMTAQDFLLGIDISEKQDAEGTAYEVLRNGVVSVSADLSPRCVLRKYVDGDRIVHLSPMERFTVRFLRIADDPVQEFIIAAAESSSDIRYCRIDPKGGLKSGILKAKISDISESDVFGIIYTAVLETGGKI